MINEESQKQLIKSAKVILQEKQKQLEIHAKYKNFNFELSKDIENTEKQIDDFFDNRTEKISELTELLQLAIKENNKENILKITSILGGMYK